MTMTNRVFAAGIWAALASSAVAHPGHGSGAGSSLVHWIVNPTHALTHLLIVVALFTCWRIVRRHLDTLRPACKRAPKR